jgi:hypothetical protein
MAETTDTLRPTGCPSRSGLNQSGVVVVAVAPTMGERIDGAEITTRRKIEQLCTRIARNVEPTQHIHHRPLAEIVGGDREHAERPPAEMMLMHSRGVRSEIGLAREARLPDVGADDRHCAAVDLDHEIVSCTAREVDCEHEIWHDADHMNGTAVAQFDSESGRID